MSRPTEWFATRASSASGSTTVATADRARSIREVEDGTPAAAAGLLAGDIVIAVDDAAVDGGAGLVAAIRDQEPGDEVSVEVLRDGERLSFVVVLTRRTES